jgi:hydrogenase expression/formation protein HypE
MTTVDPARVACPTPLAETDRVLLGHGSGGQLSAALLREVIIPGLGRAVAGGPLEDAAVLAGTGRGDLVVSTDSFVVHPRFFPGGDIGSLAVHGTINDVAMMGGDPFALSLAFIVEEGFPLADLRRVAASVGRAATAAGVPVVTGDTKVVDRGAADGLFVTTTGLGRRLPGARLSAAAVRPGDAVLLSGPIGRHGITVLSAREGLGFDGEVSSDTRALHRLTRTLVEAGGPAVHALRDPTRGGLASALNEIAQASRVGVVLDEPAIPVPPPVAAACELLGLDPLQVANEGCLVAFVAPEADRAVLAAIRSRPEGAEAVRIGVATGEHPGRVTTRTLVGAYRTVDMLVGEQLPRIC